MKKVILLVVTSLILLLSGCDIVVNQQVTLPDLTGLNREEMSEALDNLKLKYRFITEPRVYLNDDEWDQFVAYVDFEAGSQVKKGTFVGVITTALPLNLNRLDEVVLEEDYVGKSFIKDGIGLVTLNSTVDGDTAYFIDPQDNNTTVRVRFLGVDTPEVGTRLQPWGNKASQYTKNALYNAKEIVLQAEGNRKDTYDRYLAWVWLDGKLHNLDIVQQAYSNGRPSSTSKYYQIFIEVDSVISKTGRRVHGELDPSFNYQ